MKNLLFYTNHFFLLFLGGLAGGCGWLVHPIFTILMWLPLLWVINDYSRKYSLQDLGGAVYFFSLFKRLYVFFFTWNTLAAFWLLVINTAGGVFALVAIPVLMTIPLLLFHLISVKLSFTNKSLVFICCWLAYEFLQHHWELAWVWLTLGNSLANVHYLVQWYEYTGVLGGSLWILGASLLLFSCWQKKGARLKLALMLSVWLVVPTCFSLFLYLKFSESGVETEIAVVQPDLDPYTDKEKEHPRYIPIHDQNLRLIKLTKSKITQKTDLVLLPESANSSFPDVAAVTTKENWQADFRQLIDSLKELSGPAILLGLNTYSMVDESMKDEPTVILSKNKSFYFKRHNSAIFYQKDSINKVYHKSILVPGGEGFPFLSFAKKLFFFYDFRDVTTPQKERVVFKKNDKLIFAPLICYESTFGEYVGEYVKKGATVFCILTNDAYWQGTPEPKQHLMIDRLRAIEYRRSIARSSHHGHSGFINQKGDFELLTETQVQLAVRGSLQANNISTFYSKYGDFIGRLALVFVSFALATLVIGHLILKLRSKGKE